MIRRGYRMSAAGRNGDPHRTRGLVENTSPAHHTNGKTNSVRTPHETGGKTPDKNYESKETWEEQEANETRFDADGGWEEDAWLEHWRTHPDQYLVTALPLELVERMNKAIQNTPLKRTEFVLQSIDQACSNLELEKIRKNGLAEGDPAKLIKDPQTGHYRCFPTDFFSEEDLYGFEVIEGKYFQKPWAKTDAGWIQVNSGYFEATDDSHQDAPYIKMENNKPTGSWEAYPFAFFGHDWKWGIYNNPDVVLEVRGRQESESGDLWLDIYINTRHVDSVRTIQEVHDKIMDYAGSTHRS